MPAHWLHRALGRLARRRLPAAPAAAPSGVVVNTHPDAIKDVFAALTDAELSRLAEAVAALRPLAPQCDWRFGGFTEAIDLSVHVRHSIWMAAKLRGRVVDAVVPWHGGSRLRLRLDNDLSRTLFASGTFEPNLFALLDRVLRPGMIFVDGGANEGVYTVFAAARVGPAGRVIAIEPSRREFARLSANVELNGSVNVDRVMAALSDAPGAATLWIAEAEHAGQNTLGAAAYDGVAMIGAEQIAAITLDGLAAERGLDRLDVIKLDIEGAELKALAAARQGMARFKPLMLLEASETALRHQGGSINGLLALLGEAGYAPLCFDPGTGRPAALLDRDAAAVDTIIAVHRERDWGLLPKSGN